MEKFMVAIIVMCVQFINQDFYIQILNITSLIELENFFEMFNTINFCDLYFVKYFQIAKISYLHDNINRFLNIFCTLHNLDFHIYHFF